MSTQPPPSIHLHLTPQFDTLGVCSLLIRLHIPSPNLIPTQPSFSFSLFTGNVHGPKFLENDIHISDQTGDLHLRFEDVSSPSSSQTQHWFASRATLGDVVLSYTVEPRFVDKHTPLGERSDLRRDQGGVMGAGRWFLPRLLSESSYMNVVEWEEVPAGTKCVWTFGSGPGPHSQIGKMGDVLGNTIYMFGSSVNSYPEGPGHPATIYWFGYLYENLERMTHFTAKLYPKMAAHFDDLGGTYRVFFRKSVWGFGGTGFNASYVFEYSEQTKNETEWGLVRLSTHEMVHSFVVMSSEEDERSDNSWFSEGIAEYYAAILPYRFGLMDYDYALATMNSHVQAYFTSPRINMKITDAAKEFFSNWYAEWICYKRRNAYLSFIDCMLRRAANRFGIEMNGPMDEIVIDIAKRRRGGQTVRSADWLEYLGQYAIDFPFKDHFEDMLDGKTLDFSDVFLGEPEQRFDRCDTRILEYGFDRNSLRTWIVTGVQKDSVAHQAGLRDGWNILFASSHSACLEDPELTYRLDIRKDGVVKKIEYLPRRSEKALCWQILPSK